MFRQILAQDLKVAVGKLEIWQTPENKVSFHKLDIVLSIPENVDFGEYTTNIALQLAKFDTQKRYQSPRDIANDILEKLGHPSYLERTEVAGVGFINFYIKDRELVNVLSEKIQKGKDNKRILVEYASPNAAKPYHIGHLRNPIIGESLARLLELAGNEVFRANYPSDIGLPVAKVVWGLMQDTEGYKNIKGLSLHEKANYLGKVYALANKAYEEDEEAKKKIEEVNKGIYEGDERFLPVWREVRSLSAAYFDSIFSRLGIEFDATIWESEVGDLGKQVVEDNTGKVFVKDNGAVIFPGEKYGLHNRVFITSAGFPTYEAKEIGITIRESELFPFDLALHVVANEQIDYFKVVILAIEQLDNSWKDKKKHIPYGFVSLSTGKMSSRTGNVVTAEDLIDQVKQAVLPLIHTDDGPSKSQLAEKIAIAAVKFSYLKYSLGSDITFDIQKSVSLQGDSGPYVLYCYARANSVLSKAKSVDFKLNSKNQPLAAEERAILRLLEYFDTYSKQAAVQYQPNVLTDYLLKLAKAFNSFYESQAIIGSSEESFRLALTKKVAEVVQLGLYLLGIEALERM